MFLREAGLLSRLRHPNVVRLLAVDPGDEGTHPCIVMEWIDGLSLREVLDRCTGLIPIPVATQIAYDLALGLHAAHELRNDSGELLGVVHRDVSPQNVLVTLQGECKLLDFGVAKTSEGTHTVTGEVKGKIGYMAPEQALADPLDRRCDLYALGAVLYELLAGQRMHGTGTDMELLRRLAFEKPAPVESLRPETPAALARLVASLIAERPEERPATAQEVAEALFLLNPAGADGIARWLSTQPELLAVRRDRLIALQAALETEAIAPPREPSPAPVRRRESPRSWRAALVIMVTMGLLWIGSRALGSPVKTVVVPIPNVAPSVVAEVSAPRARLSGELAPATRAPMPESKASVSPPSARPRVLPVISPRPHPSASSAPAIPLLAPSTSLPLIRHPLEE